MKQTGLGQTKWEAKDYFGFGIMAICIPPGYYFFWKYNFGNPHPDITSLGFTSGVCFAIAAFVIVGGFIVSIIGWINKPLGALAAIILIGLACGLSGYLTNNARRVSPEAAYLRETYKGVDLSPYKSNDDECIDAVKMHIFAKWDNAHNKEDTLNISGNYTEENFNRDWKNFESWFDDHSYPQDGSPTLPVEP